jgi:DNA repair protein RadC
MADQPEYHITIHQFPEEERPRERMLKHGPMVLSNAELIAILLRSGTRGENVVNLSTRLLVEQGGLVGLSRASFDELARVKGVGNAKFCQLKAALELGRRLLIASPDQRPQITCPADAANLLMLEMGPLEQEHLKVLILDTKNYVMASPEVYVGNVNTSVIRIGEVFKEAVRRNATSTIIIHNHPSGDPTPSPEDVQVTQRIIEAGKLLDIDVLDHIIIGNQRFISLKERGLAF